MYLFAKTGANVRRPLSVGTLIPLLTLLMTAHAPYNLAQTPTPSAPPAPVPRACAPPAPRRARRTSTASASA